MCDEKYVRKTSGRLGLILAVEKLWQKVKIEIIRRRSSVDSLQKGVFWSLDMTCSVSSYEFGKNCRPIH